VQFSVMEPVLFPALAKQPSFADSTQEAAMYQNIRGRNNVIAPAKHFISQYGDEAYTKAREAQLTALKDRRRQLAPFYGKVAEKIEEVTAQERAGEGSGLSGPILGLASFPGPF
jgi:hypothetical protein